MSLAILTEPGLLYALLPMAVIFAGFLTFELAMGVTIATLPRSRFQHKWTDAERRRVTRVFLTTFSVWPVAAMVIIGHVYFSPMVAIIADVLAGGLVLLAVRWFVQGVRHRNLVMLGHCVNCLYDLRAHHDSETCPECGTDLRDHPQRVEKRRQQRTAEQAKAAA